MTSSAAVAFFPKAFSVSLVSSRCKTPELFCGLENVTRASVNTGLSSELMTVDQNEIAMKVCFCRWIKCVFVSFCFVFGVVFFVKP